MMDVVIKMAKSKCSRICVGLNRCEWKSWHFSQNVTGNGMSGTSRKSYAIVRLRETYFAVCRPIENLNNSDVAVITDTNTAADSRRFIFHQFVNSMSHCVPHKHTYWPNAIRFTVVTRHRKRPRRRRRHWHGQPPQRVPVRSETNKQTKKKKKKEVKIIYAETEIHLVWTRTSIRPLPLASSTLPAACW